MHQLICTGAAGVSRTWFAAEFDCFGERQVRSDIPPSMAFGGLGACQICRCTPLPILGRSFWGIVVVSRWKKCPSRYPEVLLSTG